MQLVLNEKLLNTLLAIQRKRMLALTEASMELVDSWESDLNTYIDNLPVSYFEDLGLKRNHNCLRVLKTFDVPSEWMEAEISDYPNFSFSYPG